MLNQIMFQQIYINITDKITTFVLNKLNYNFYYEANYYKNTNENNLKFIYR